MNNRSKVYAAANYVMSAAFLYFAYLQFNDENAIRWSLIYGVAALACILYLIHRLPWFFSAAIGVLAIVWALTKIPDLVGQDLPMDEVFGTMRMISTAVQECREMLGLLIVAFWMSTLTFFTRRSVKVKS
jgi:Transmembrane family 220, helix